MNPWIIITFVLGGVVFGLDFVFRRKKWNDNSKEEKISLTLNMLSVGLYIFLSAAGILWGIVPCSPKTALGETLYHVTLKMGGTFYIIAIIAVIGSFILRKTAKVKASIWINVIALVYIVAVLSVNSLTGKLL